MVEWHKPNLDPETIADIIREGREENDKKFENYAEYVGYIAKDNDRILNEYDHDHSQCEPNELTKEAMDEAIEDSMDDVFVSSLDGSESTLKEILEALGSDYDDNGTPYWEKWEKDSNEDDGGLSQRGYNSEQIQGRDDV